MIIRIRDSWNRFYKYRPLIHELVSKDLKVQYRRSFLGYLWSLLNPLLMMAVQSVVFSTLFKRNIEFFPLYLICGNTLFTFMNRGSTQGLYSIIGNTALIKKVYIPKYIFPISRVASSFVSMLFSLAAVMIVMIFLRAPFHITSLLFWIPLFMLFLFTCGLSLLLSALAAKFRDVEHLYSVLVLAWMYLTPLFYPLSAIPETYRWIMELNPMTYYVTLFRDLVMYGSYGTPETWRWCIASATGSLLLGSLVFKKMQRNFILYI